MASSERPKIAETPLELLNSPGIEPGLVNKYYNPVIGAFLGVVGALTGNWGTKRPLWSGIQKHFMLGIGGAALGYYLDQRRNQKLAEKDAILRNYVELHPDDFPPYERIKYRDVFEKWIPIR